MLKGREAHKERKAEYEESSWWLFCWRRALLTSELAVYLQVFAGCLSGETPGDTKRAIWPILLLLQSQNLGVFHNWLCGSQECILVLQRCPTPCIPPNSSSLCAAAWHLLSISPAVWAGWGSDLPAGSCTASGILQAAWSRSWASSSCSSGCASAPGPSLLLSPRLLLSLLRSSLDRGCSSPR